MRQAYEQRENARRSCGTLVVLAAMRFGDSASPHAKQRRRPALTSLPVAGERSSATETRAASPVGWKAAAEPRDRETLRGRPRSVDPDARLEAVALGVPAPERLGDVAGL